MNRRGFIAGFGSIIAAPAIVRAESLMKVRGVIVPTESMIEIVQRGMLHAGSDVSVWRISWGPPAGDIFPKMVAQDWDFVVRGIPPSELYR